MMLDSGASISLVRKDTATWLPRSQPVSEASVHVVSATGETIPVLGRVTLPVQVGPIEVEHSLVVVQSLITPVILGIDFLQAHGLILDFTTTPVHVTTQPVPDSSLKPLCNEEDKSQGECYPGNRRAFRRSHRRMCNPYIR